MGKRIALVDIAKGISIILVAYGHSQVSLMFPEANRSLTLFRMPLFFFLSGVFFRPSSNLAVSIFKKTDTLLKPYFFTLFIHLIISILSGKEQIANQIAGIFYGNGETIRWTPLWFLTHLWLLYIVSYGVFALTRLQDRSNLVKCCFVIVLMTIGLQIQSMFWFFPISLNNNMIELPGLPYSSDIIFFSMAFFMSGYFLSKKVIHFKLRLDILCVTLITFFIIDIATEAFLDLNKRQFDEPIYTIVAAFSGIYIVLSISYLISKSALLTKILVTFGSTSLFILLFHEYISTKTYMIFSHLSPIDCNIFYAALSFMISITLPLYIRKLILKNKFFTFFYFPYQSKLFHRLEKR